MTLRRLSIGSLQINQWCREYLHSQEAENNLLADKKGHRKGGGYLSVYIYTSDLLPESHITYFLNKNALNKIFQIGYFFSLIYEKNHDDNIHKSEALVR